MRQLGHHRTAFRRGIEIAQRRDLGQGHHVGHQFRLLAHQVGHRLGEGGKIQLPDRGDLGLGQRGAPGGDLLQHRLIHAFDQAVHVEFGQRQFDIFLRHRDPRVARFGQGGQGQGQKGQQRQRFHGRVIRSRSSRRQRCGCLRGHRTRRPARR